MAACHFHPDRAGIGVCMRCGRVICEICCTRLDGVNHCHACLQALAAPAPASQTANVLWPLTATLLLLGGCTVLFALGWLTQGSLAP